MNYKKRCYIKYSIYALKQISVGFKIKFKIVVRMNVDEQINQIFKKLLFLSQQERKYFAKTS